MNFMESKTYINLARSFAGESQAGLRYQFIARESFKQGYKILSDEIRKIAKNETNHAQVFFDKLIELAGPQNNIEICAGYPFNGGNIEDGLKYAMEGELQESSVVYPEFRDIALKEGYVDIARIYDKVIQVEASHKVIFEYMYKNFKNNTLYKSDTPVMWKCSNCGYYVISEESFHICPLCQVSQGFVELHLPKK